MPKYRDDIPFTQADLAALVGVLPQNVTRGKAGRALAQIPDYARKQGQHAYDEPGAMRFCELMGTEYDPRKAGR